MVILASVTLVSLIVLYRGNAMADRTPPGFTRVQVAGLTTLISPDLQADPALRERVMWRLEEQLTAAMKVLPAAGREALRDVRIWVDPAPEADDDPSGPSGSLALGLYIGQTEQVDPESGLRQAQAGDIVIPHPLGLIRAHGQINVLLHELAHAYDDRHLKFEDPGVSKAFNAAKKSGQYHLTDVPAGFEHDSYAMRNEREYFAVLTEAYFGTREQQPRNRAQLRTFDPQGYTAIEHAWGAD
ncbi:anthrax toxin lethal factor-related metalloendopeptidase [Deinococcus navajonensis]|uniref:Anthrax toxin lethal/endema factor N-/C-terminal domain-containing protein n=1 Tax=Deinococcus navajonensis TaxID=309884 RepID=A0ABV8XHR4_9DEIO